MDHGGTEVTEENTEKNTEGLSSVLSPCL